MRAMLDSAMASASDFIADLVRFRL